MLPGSSSDFPASYDLTTKIISAVACTVLLLAVVATHMALVGCIAGLVIFVGFAFSPRRYSVSGQEITVQRLIGDVHVPLQRVREARRTTPDDFRGCIRLWGSGGFFGYYGLFRTSKLGKSWWYVTNRRNTVVVAAERKTALFSPDDVEGFLAAIRSSVPVSMGPIESSNGMRQPFASQRSPAKWIGIGIAAVVLSVVAFALLYSPGAPKYTLTYDALTIHDWFYPVTIKAADVDVQDIRIVDIRADSEWRPTRRTNGFANPHYHSGWFRVASGQKVRMYWANGTRLVLIPAKGNNPAVLVQVENPDAFIDQLRREWGQ